MKNFLVLGLLIASLFGFGQSKDKISIFNRKNEIKIGTIHLLGGPILEGSYEYIYSKDFTFGTSVLLSLDNTDYYSEELSVTPFARFYFQETKEYGAQGFFVEGFAKYFTGKYDKNLLFGDNPKEFSAAALGIGVGKKWINSSGFIFETLVGLGRTLGGSDNNQILFLGEI